MISKSKIKWIKSLSQRKIRDEERLFVAEGEKLTGDLLATSLQLFEIYTTGAPELYPFLNRWREHHTQISAAEMERITSFRTPSDVLAIFRMPGNRQEVSPTGEGLTLLLDGIQDPGNLGTIIRMADWFGIRIIYCSSDCADLYNPKTVQSTMGALARVSVCYTSLTEIITQARSENIPVMGTFMQGDNLYKTTLPSDMMIVMGSEGRGISDEVARLLTHRITIPAWPEGDNGLESLNVGVAAAIVCAEQRRQLMNRG